MGFDKVKRLQEKAMFLRLLLENYVKKSQQIDDVSQLTVPYMTLEGYKGSVPENLRNLLQRMTPLFEEVEQGKVIPPIKYELDRGDFHSDNSYIAAHPILWEAAVDFAFALRDEESSFDGDDRNQASLLRERVIPFRQLLEHYAEKDDAAKQLLTAMQPLLDDINQCKVTPPIVNEYRWWFTNRESPLFDKYLDLTEAASRYDGYVESGWPIRGE